MNVSTHPQASQGTRARFTQALRGWLTTIRRRRRPVSAELTDLFDARAHMVSRLERKLGPGETGLMAVEWRYDRSALATYGNPVTAIRLDYQLPGGRPGCAQFFVGGQGWMVGPALTEYLTGRQPRKSGIPALDEALEHARERDPELNARLPQPEELADFIMASGWWLTRAPGWRRFTPWMQWILFAVLLGDRRFGSRWET